jgi:hypothetical protein
VTTTILDVGMSPTDILPIWVDWTPWLSGERAQGGTLPVITSSSWAVESGAWTGLVVLGSPPPALAGKITTAWISGGVAGGRYVVVNTIETDLGHVVSRAIRVVVS